MTLRRVKPATARCTHGEVWYRQCAWCETEYWSEVLRMDDPNPWRPIALALKYGGAIILGRDAFGVEFLTEWLPEAGRWLQTISPYEPVEFQHH